VREAERVVGGEVEEREDKVDKVDKQIDKKVDKEIEVNKTD
jgi:hypothetical protein